jgi:hypothetical protein
MARVESTVSSGTTLCVAASISTFRPNQTSSGAPKDDHDVADFPLSVSQEKLETLQCGEPLAKLAEITACVYLGTNDSRPREQRRFSALVLRRRIPFGSDR